MKLRAIKIGHSGFNIPFGYDYKDGVLQILPNEAEIVKSIYSQYLSGKSLGEIVKMLNLAKIPTKRGGIWAKKTISTILKNPVYCGYHRYEEKLTRGKHNKIIDAKIHKEVQKLICEKGGKQKNYDFD
jgi:site-specific DNA recombinase